MIKITEKKRKMKNQRRNIQTPTKMSTNIPKSSSPNQDNFKDARGKVGLFPISIDDIKQHVKDDADDISIMTKYEYIEARNKAAQNFLVNNMHFQEEEIKIFTLKMAANWTSRIMWIEIGENNVKRLQNRAMSLKNPNIQLVTYFPAQLWNKQKLLNENSKSERSKKSQLLISNICW